MSIDALVNVLSQWVTPLCVGALMVLFAVRLLPVVYHDGTPDRARFRTARAAALPAAVTTLCLVSAIWVAMQFLPAHSEVLLLFMGPVVLTGGTWSIELSRKAVLTQDYRE